MQRAVRARGRSCHMIFCGRASRPVCGAHADSAAQGRWHASTMQLGKQYGFATIVCHCLTVLVTHRSCPCDALRWLPFHAA